VELPLHLSLLKNRLARRYFKLFIVPQGEGGMISIFLYSMARWNSIQISKKRELFLNTEELILDIIKSRFTSKFINVLTENNPTREVE